MHNHSDYTILVEPKAESMIRQGVTTMVIGESRSAGPVNAKASNGQEPAGLTVDQRFPHAQDRREPVPQRSQDFLLNILISFSEERATFRMADDHIAAAKIAQHRSGHFPGEGPVRFPVHILCAEAEIGGRAQGVAG